MFLPETGELRPYDDQLQEALLSEDPLKALREWERVPLVEEDDAAMTEAMSEAKRRWPEFASAFESRGPEQRFLVKAAFRDSDATEGEWMWVLMSSLSDDMIEG